MKRSLRGAKKEWEKALREENKVIAVTVLATLSALFYQRLITSKGEEALFDFVRITGEKALSEEWVQLTIQIHRFLLRSDLDFLPKEKQAREKLRKTARTFFDKLGRALAFEGGGRRAELTEEERGQNIRDSNRKSKSKLDEQTRRNSSSLNEEIYRETVRYMRKNNLQEVTKEEILKIVSPLLEKARTATSAARRRAAEGIQGKLLKSK